jgi:hypothetical protein
MQKAIIIIENSGNQIFQSQSRDDLNLGKFSKSPKCFYFYLLFSIFYFLFSIFYFYLLFSIFYFYFYFYIVSPLWIYWASAIAFHLLCSTSSALTNFQASPTAVIRRPDSTPSALSSAYFVLKKKL